MVRASACVTKGIRFNCWSWSGLMREATNQCVFHIDAFCSPPILLPSLSNQWKNILRNKVALTCSFSAQEIVGSGDWLPSLLVKGTAILQLHPRQGRGLMQKFRPSAAISCAFQEKLGIHIFFNRLLLKN